MKKAICAITIVTLAVLLFIDNAKADAFEAEGLYPAACILSNPDLSTYKEVKDILKEQGARGLQSFPPSVIFGRFPPGLAESAFGGLAVTIVRSPYETAFGEIDPVTSRVVRNLFNEREFLKASVPLDAGRLEDMVLRVPEEAVAATRHDGPRLGSPSTITARGINQNSEFMMGDVLVNIIFPESEGVGLEDWTEEEISNAVSGIVIGTSQYQQKALWIDLNFEHNYEDFKQVPVSREPIYGDWNVDYLWMSEALTNLGYEDREGLFVQVHELNNDMRALHGADWVFTAFVVDASDIDGNCWGTNPGYVAYAYLGGPFMLVPFPACRFGTGIGFSHVFIHEMSHIFWALDEYASAQSSCNDRSGYRAIENRNTYYKPCQANVPCIMNNAPLEAPLPICEYTLGQVGIVDINWNSIPDIYEVYPSIEFLTFPGASDTILGDDYMLAATVWCDAVENINPGQSPSERIDYAAYLVKGWQELNHSGFTMDLEPNDGKWDEWREQLSMFLSGFEPGRNTLTLTVENCVGLRNSAEKHIFRVGLKYYQTSVDPHDDGIEISWKTPGVVFGATFDIMREDLSDGGGEEKITTVVEPEQADENKRFYTYTDNTTSAAHKYSYRIVGEFDFRVSADSIKHYVVSSNSIVETAPIPVGRNILSALLPNPTPEGAMFTVKVPKTYENPSGDQNTFSRGGLRGTAALVETMTPVDIGVYNVKGELVRTIFNQKVYGGRMTMEWNGKTKYGERAKPGVYFLRVEAGGNLETRKLIILR